MMNYSLSQIPERSEKPRSAGVTMVMDKGLSLREVDDFLSVAGDYTDIVKLGWATSAVTPRLKEKLDIYRSAGIPTYFGGTLLEAFWVRNQIEDYYRLLEKYDMKLVEVSNGSIDISDEDKLGLIRDLSKNYRVLSEVGSKTDDKLIPPYQWVEMMQNELNAGAWKVIAEARESGTVGMFLSDGSVRSDLIEEILHGVAPENIMWEAPQKSQQVWFIKLLGSNVNLGNIAPSEAIPLETLRLGLRGDTFNTFLS